MNIIYKQREKITDTPSTTSDMVFRRNEGIRERGYFCSSKCCNDATSFELIVLWIMDAFIILKNSTHRYTDAYMPYSWVHLAKVIGYLLQNVHLSILCSDFLFNLRPLVNMFGCMSLQTPEMPLSRSITFKLDKREEETLFRFWLVLHLSNWNYESGLRLLISRSSAPLNTHISLEILAQLSHFNTPTNPLLHAYARCST